jgi:hypothetical protein
MLKDDKLPFWFRAFLSIGAGPAVLLGEILKLFIKPETYYSCPACNADIKYNDESCHQCHALLEWPFKEDVNKD